MDVSKNIFRNSIYWSIISYYLVNNGVYDICFLLPNDEQKYYSDTYFTDDLKRYLKLMHVDNEHMSKICVNFISFKFSTHTKARPYNAGSEILSTITIDILL